MLVSSSHATRSERIVGGNNVGHSKEMRSYFFGLRHQFLVGRALTSEATSRKKVGLHSCVKSYRGVTPKVSLFQSRHSLCIGLVRYHYGPINSSIVGSETLSKAEHICYLKNV